MHILLILLLLPLPVLAESPNAVVFAHECKSVDQVKSGLRCGTGRGVMALHWVRSKKTMTPAERKIADYEYSRITMRYFDLGGRHFDVTASHWPAGAVRQCAIRPNRAIYCSDFICRAGGTCDPVAAK